MRILLAEGDAPLASFVRKGLEAEHYAVDLCSDGAEAVFLAEQFGYDLMVLDLNVPCVDGLDVLRSARGAKPGLLILALSGSSQAEDRARCLDLGADDVLTRPFSFCELAARLRALLRRSTQPAESILRVADLELDRVAHTVRRASARIFLTAKEFSLLEYLTRNRGRALSRAMIVEHVWNLNFDTTTNVVDVYINYLRRKVDDGFDPPLIHTVWGVGYKLEAAEGADRSFAPRRAAPGAIAGPQPVSASQAYAGPTAVSRGARR
jgi:two-component system copper resistance phosphate regulon response regulator CusR